jgi:hypothetical protein
MLIGFLVSAGNGRTACDALSTFRMSVLFETDSRRLRQPVHLLRNNSMQRLRGAL